MSSEPKYHEGETVIVPYPHKHEAKVRSSWESQGTWMYEVARLVEISEIVPEEVLQPRELPTPLISRPEPSEPGEERTHA